MAARLLAQHSGGDVSVVSLQLQVAAAKQQADAAASRGATLSLKHQQCCGRVEGLQGDAARVAAALQENEAQQQQAETQIQRLRGEADGREKQLRGAATAAERAQQHQGASQAAAQGARAALAAVEAQLLLQQQQREAGTRRGRKGGQGKQSIDEAVAALAAASAAGQLPGLLHGRLHSVARLAHPAAGRAANAALMELCNLVSPLTWWKTELGFAACLDCGMGMLWHELSITFLWAVQSSTLVVADRRTAQAEIGRAHV